MVSLALSRSTKAWISVAIACSVCCLLRFSRGTRADPVADGHDLQHRRKLFSLIRFRDPATTAMKNSQLYADLAPFIEPVEINPDSTISSDLYAIWHNQNLANVCLRLKVGSRCSHPSLIGRLHGKSIAMLEWSLASSTDSPFIEYCGSYANAWLDPGTYFLEILIIHCNGFGTTALETIKTEAVRVRKWLQFDYTYECVEDAAHNRITGTNTFLSITRSFYGAGDKHIGRWELLDESNYVSDNFPSQKFTRYQPQGCRENDPDHFLDKCQIPMHNTRLNEYSFLWNEDQRWIEQIEKFQSDFSDQLSFQSLSLWSHQFHNALKQINYEYEEPPICIMGDSHSHHLWKSMFLLNLGHRFVTAGR